MSFVGEYSVPGGTAKLLDDAERAGAGEGEDVVRDVGCGERVEGGVTGLALLQVVHDMGEAFDINWDGGDHDSRLRKVYLPNDEVGRAHKGHTNLHKEIVCDRPVLNWCIFATTFDIVLSRF
jgi:hypothetical protein